jgi:hypothetical protein
MRMKRLVLGAVVAALCGVPVVSRAELPGATPQVAAPAERDAQPGAASDASSETSGDEASEFAAREKAAPPQLAEFSGGADGIYITSGAIIAALLVVLLITAL